MMLLVLVPGSPRDKAAPRASAPADQITHVMKIGELQLVCFPHTHSTSGMLFMSLTHWLIILPHLIAGITRNISRERPRVPTRYSVKRLGGLRTPTSACLTQRALTRPWRIRRVQCTLRNLRSVRLIYSLEISAKMQTPKITNAHQTTCKTPGLRR